MNTRRSFLSALAVPALAVAAASTDADAALVALGRELEDAWRVERAIFAQYNDDDSMEAEQVCFAARDRSEIIAHRIEAATATTFAGLQAKALALAWTHNGEALDTASLFDVDDERVATDHRLIVGIIRDLRAIA